MPSQSSAVHLGAATCGQETCHGSGHPWQNSAVSQTEYLVWSKSDAHSKAFAVLGSERAQRIARNLGMPAPQEARLCLSCHSDLAAADRRGPKYQVSDGVDCESCHSPASEWLANHTSGLYSHAEHIAAGMYPTEDPSARGRLCLSCHFGTGEKFVGHGLIAAGHPRLSFELDTFTAAEPAHFRVNDEYRQRKGNANGIRTWAMGQAEAAHALLTRLSATARSPGNLLPELALFNCYDCHRPIVVGASASNALPRVNLASVTMLQIATSVAAPNLTGSLGGGVARVNGAATENASAVTGAAMGLDGAVRHAESVLAGYTWDPQSRRALLRAFAQAARAGRFADFIEAEQATYGIAAVLAEMTTAGQITEDRFRPRLDALYTAVGKAESYNPGGFVAAVSAVVQQVDDGGMQ